MQEHLLDSLNGNLPPNATPTMGPGAWPEGHQSLESNLPLNGYEMAPHLGENAGNAASNAAKKSSSRRNAWGNLSYADLITQAIQSAPEKRLTLSQVYEWMVANIPYFKDKGDSNSSAGWKVSELCIKNE